MSKPLFPQEFINSSLEHYTFKISKRSNAIYLVLLTSILGVLLLLPLVWVDITVTAQGNIGTREQKYELVSPVSARILSYDIVENKSVNKDEVIATFDQSFIQEELNQINMRLSQLEAFQEDLALLIKQKVKNQLELQTTRYQLEFSQFLSSINKLKLENEISNKVHTRQKALFEGAIIAAAEYEQDKSRYDMTLAEIDYFKKHNISLWKQASLSIEQDQEQLRLRQKVLTNELDKYILIAPIRGEIQKISSLRSGQFVQAGMKLGELSPDTTLMAICWVKPNNIGLLQKGMTASFRITAFDSNEWGFLDGTVSEISSDAYIINDHPYFKVECILNKTFMSLRNGFKGGLKKGMTLQANFKVTNRTLYQLLHDKLDDWFNPQNIKV